MPESERLEREKDAVQNRHSQEIAKINKRISDSKAKEKKDRKIKNNLNDRTSAYNDFVKETNPLSMREMLTELKKMREEEENGN